MSLSYGRIPTVDTILHATGGNIQKIYNLAGVPEFLKVAAAMTARRYHDAVQSSANPNPPTIAAQAYGNPPGVPVGAAGAPPAPVGGLGATPQAAPPMAPQMAAAAPQEAPMGMAEGGIVGIDIPDTMFDESSNGGFDDGYAGGGLVAFAAGSPGQAMSFQEDFDATFGKKGQPEELSYYGYSLDPRKNMGIASEMMGTPESKYSGMLQQDLEETFNPDAIKKQGEARKGDLLLELATGLLANESPNFGVALGRAGARALTRAREVERLDKADRMFARKALADLEAGRNTQRAQVAAQALQMHQMAIQGYEAETGRKFQATENQKNRNLDLLITNIRERGDTTRAAMRASGDGTAKADKPKTNAQLAIGMKEARRNADAAYAEAVKAEKAGDVAEVTRQLKVYGQNRGTYNRYAAQRGESELPQADLSIRAFPKLNAYRNKHGRLPGAQVNKNTAVQNGRIVSVSDIPPAR